jgi:hypothetical protein
MGSLGVRRPMPGEGQKGDTHGGERNRPEKPTHRAHGREQPTGGSSPRRNVGASATETRGGATGREQREQAYKRQRPNPRPDLKRGRDGDGRASAGGATPARAELIEENKRMLTALSQRYPGQLELRAPLGGTPLNLRMQAQTAARYEDILAHVTLTGAGSRDSRLLPIWEQTRVWDPGD